MGQWAHAVVDDEQTPYPYAWGYLNDRAKVRHVRVKGLNTAVCGTSPGWWSGDWRGTGTQAEYERCALLKSCGNCVKVLPACKEWKPLK